MEEERLKQWQEREQKSQEAKQQEKTNLKEKLSSYDRYLCQIARRAIQKNAATFSDETTEYTLTLVTCFDVLPTENLKIPSLVKRIDTRTNQGSFYIYGISAENSYGGFTLLYLSGMGLQDFFAEFTRNFNVLIEKFCRNRILSRSDPEGAIYRK